MEGEIKRERASTNVPGDVPVIEGVPPAFFEFLSAQLTRFEASFGARLSAIEESIRATNTRIDETQRSIRKLKRSISQDLTHSLNTPSGGDYPLVSERSSDTLSPRKASRAVRIHFGILMMLCTPEEANYLLTSFIFWFFVAPLYCIGFLPQGIKKPPGLSVSAPDLASNSDGSSPRSPHSARIPETIPEIEVSDQLLERGVRPLQHYLRNAIAVRKLAQLSTFLFYHLASILFVTPRVC